jgi:hypothetical protein
MQYYECSRGNLAVVYVNACKFDRYFHFTKLVLFFFSTVNVDVVFSLAADQVLV